MSLTGAMNAAMSGMRAAVRGSEVVSNNISNALTPSYAKRSLELSALNYGSTGGVKIDGISRQVNEGILADKRFADASQQNAQTTVDFYNQLEDAVGLAGDANGLSGRLAAFEESLISAASRPDATERLSGAVVSAQWLVDGISNASKEIQQIRTNADTQIAQEVAVLNSTLEQIQGLNEQIATSLARGDSSPALLDQRQVALDTIGAIVPINVVPRDNGSVTIYSEGGAILLDITPAKIGFDQQNMVTEFQTFGVGTLSGLSLNGQDLRTSALGGGSLGGYFEVRDSHGVQAQTQLDAIARDLVERFSDPSVDTTLTTGDAGLFADAGNAFNPSDEVGLSSRLTLNNAVNPDAGGDVSRLRDGLGTLIGGPSGDATLLNNLRNALDTTRVPGSSVLGSSARAMPDLLSSFSSSLATSRSGAEQVLSFSSARLNELTELQLSDGVDTDQELQNLLLIEQAYAANARVIQAANEMFETLTRL